MRRSFQNLRFAIRTLARRPGFTLAAVLTLGLGIGANTAIFTLIDSVLLSPLPYDAPDRLVRVLRVHPTARYTAFSYPDLRDLRDENTVFTEVAGHAFGRWALTGSGDPVLLEACRVTEGFFDILGVTAERGRLFRPEDFRAGAEKTVVLDHSTWLSRFGGDVEIIGKQIRLQDDLHTVVGVLPEGAIQYPSSDIDVWAPARLGENDGRGSRWLGAIARLEPGASLQQAQFEAHVIADRLARAHPEANRDRTITLEPLRDHMVADVQALLLVLMAAVGVILLIACANVANLLLARATSRAREIAIRMAMGAGRRHILRQLLTESVGLALLGGIVGVVFAFWCVDAFLALSPEKLPRQGEIGVDLSVLGFSVAVGVLTGLLAGLLPALQGSRPRLSETLKEGDARSGTGRSRRRMRSALAGAQIALSAALLIAAGLLLKSFAQLLDVDPGFRPERVVSVGLALPSSRYPDRSATLSLYDRLTAEIGSLPRVSAVATGSMLPLSGHNWCNGFILEGRQDEEEDCAEFRAVSPDYFRVMGVRVLAGRTFSDADDEDATRVAVIDETLARRYWAGESAIGHEITIFDEPRTIVGVVAATRDFGLDSRPKQTIYLPHRQRPLPFTNIVARTASDAASLLPAIRTRVWSLDPDLPIYGLATLESMVSSSVAAPRFRSALLAAFAMLALTLAAIGIYSVIAYDVSQRTREIGVRVALGARGVDVIRQVVADAGRVAVLGLATGLLIAALATRALRSFLFHVQPLDTTVYVAVTLFLLVVALAATYVPARRASRTDPMSALRQ